MILEIRDLKTYFHTSEGIARAVDGVSFTINEGETYSLVGESGCGKSMTALSIMQLLPEGAGYFAGGEIFFNNQDIIRMRESRKRSLRGNEISMIFQEPMTSLNPVLTVGYQIMEVLLEHRRLKKNEAREIALEYLERVQIPEPGLRFHEYPFQLSGGMKQRVMIAMALACRPKLLIADEPTTALDVTVQEQILSLLMELKNDNNTAILFITHDLGVVSEIADRVAVMYGGQIVEEGDTKTILTSAMHPYTKKLLRSHPSGKNSKYYLETIKGRVPPAYMYPQGCRFADRCSYAMSECSLEDIAAIKPKKGHSVACIMYDSRHKRKFSFSRNLVKDEKKIARKRDSKGSEKYLDIQDLRVHFPIKKGILKKTVGYVKAVDGIDLTLEKGKTLALVGESGCGKTTLGKSILKLIPFTKGNVFLNGQNLIQLNENEFHPYRKRMQIIFQDPYSSLDPRMMVGEILSEGMSAHKIGANRQERIYLAQKLLEQVGLEGYMVSRYPHEFSGGQRQRIGIARCLALDPEFIICDEATSSLDVSVQASILNLLENLKKARNLTYLFITHDLSVVEYIADFIAVMYLGRIVESGTISEVFSSPKHPYTRALLSAIPQLDKKRRKKIILEGDVPSPVNPPQGCHYHPRCPEKMEICSKTYPGQTELSKTGKIRCYLYQK